ncbi:TPA: DUF4424 family protein [Escherichia albertii]|uniref:DUF4424 family protein n=1 Tax=Escherichia albertii TaxID=208962 RepID=UPI000743E4BD|nr:DUF4424 family protein [Escherichia albertii]WDB46781.1 DUF4424 family protein [Escherichia albertii]HEB1530366.1 DUF4424 family protein [Escherichia albertii]HEB1530880.1 DUF4424 family protein [Escherichia albertii]
MPHTTLFFLLIAFSTATCANDTWWGENNGTIEFLQQNDISMAKERLLISPDRINVDYLFINHSSQDITLPMAFPMPIITKDSEIDGKSPGIGNFQLSVDGKPIATESRWIVMRTDNTGKIEEDITKQIQQTGWTPDQLIDVLQGFNIQPDMPEQWFKDKIPLFTLQQYFVWQQNFPAEKEVVIHHSYSPSLSGGLPLSTKTLPSFAPDKCLNHATLRKLQQLEKTLTKEKKNPDSDVIGWTRLEYILTTGANWKNGSIGDFTLRIHKPQPDDILATCFKQPLKLIDSTTYEFRQKNFKPQNDLFMTFYYAAPGK